MNPFLPLALSLLPELAAALLGPGADAAIAAVEQAVRQATGTPDAEAARLVLARDPVAAGRLRADLARVAASANRASAAAARPAGGVLPWTPALVSVVVLLAFAIAVWAAMTRTLPAGSQTVATMLLGTLAAMATSVVSYWVGSSAGSATKTELLFRDRPGPGSAQPAGPGAAT